jgi:5-methyltetrahydrofolate--homocysteine methyltransferase
MSTTIEEIRQAIIDGNVKAAAAKVQQGVNEGILAETLLNDGLITAMRKVGQLFEEGEVFVPEMLVAARCMSASMNILKPLLVAEGVKPIARVAIGTVKGDLHDIGKNLVAMMLQGSGFEIIDLGVDVAPERFVEAVKDGAQVIAMSALLTTTMRNMQAIIQALKDAGLRDRVKVVVGGAPITQEYANEIGADGFAPDASTAARRVHDLVGV